MFWIGFLVGILVLPALLALTWLVFFLIDAIPYCISCIKEYFLTLKAKKLARKSSVVVDAKDVVEIEEVNELPNNAKVVESVEIKNDKAE